MKASRFTRIVAQEALGANLVETLCADGRGTFAVSVLLVGSSPLSELPKTQTLARLDTVPRDQRGSRGRSRATAVGTSESTVT